MGFKVRKSFKIAPGVKLNVGNKSMGVSIGGKGLRYSINTRTGSRATVGIPGTGISYSTTSRKYTSSSYSKSSQLKKLQQEQNKLQEIERNKLEVELYENRIEIIKSIHKECDENINWIEVENLESPFKFEDGEKGKNELDAIIKLKDYKPSLKDKILGLTNKKIKELEGNIENAKQQDQSDYMEWKHLHDIAVKINSGDIDSYFEVINEFRPLDDLLEFGSGFEFFIEEPNWLEVDFDVNTNSVVPNESKVLTRTGKVSTKKLSKTSYYDLQQDYICSCSLRIARDMFALLPLEYIVINALEKRLDTSTGKFEKVVVLSVKIDKNTLNTLNMDLIDPSDSMSNFKCNMNFKKTTGLGKVNRVIQS